MTPLILRSISWRLQDTRILIASIVWPGQPLPGVESDGALFYFVTWGSPAWNGESAKSIRINAFNSGPYLHVLVWYYIPHWINQSINQCHIYRRHRKSLTVTTMIQRWETPGYMWYMWCMWCMWYCVIRCEGIVKSSNRLPIGKQFAPFRTRRSPLQYTDLGHWPRITWSSCREIVSVGITSVRRSARRHFVSYTTHIPACLNQVCTTGCRVHAHLWCSIRQR